MGIETISIKELTDLVEKGAEVRAASPIEKGGVRLVNTEHTIDMNTVDKFEGWGIDELGIEKKEEVSYVSFKERTSDRKPYEPIFKNFAELTNSKANQVYAFIREKKMPDKLVQDAVHTLLIDIRDFGDEFKLKEIITEYWKALISRDSSATLAVKESAERGIITCKLLDHVDYTQNDKAGTIKKDFDYILMAAMLQDIALLAKNEVIDLSRFRGYGARLPREVNEKNHARVGAKIFNAVFKDEWTVGKVGIRMHEERENEKWDKYFSYRLPALGNELYTFTREKGWHKDVSPEGIFRVQANSIPGELEKISGIANDFHTLNAAISEKKLKKEILGAYLNFIKSLGIKFESSEPVKQFVDLTKRIGNVKLSEVEGIFVRNYIGGLEKVHYDVLSHLANGNGSNS